MITAGIIILQINHLSIGVSEEFIKQKVNKLMIFFIHQHAIGEYSEESICSRLMSRTVAPFAR